ncbi:MAG: hypothetical protein R3B09_26510 [Nannocystaceae bacterium]
MQRSTFFVFGATSELARHLFARERAFFERRVERLVLVQRSGEIDPVYADFSPSVVQAEVSDINGFRETLDRIVAEYAEPGRRLEVFPTYGRFTWNYAPKSPRFVFSDEGLQVNLNCRLQILDAFRPFRATTTFHLLGSLFSCFPYTGDYALGMWYVNQLPTDPNYADFDLRVYNLGGMRTRFWRHEGVKNPLIHEEIPTAALVAAMGGDRRGSFYFYPTAASRLICWLGRRGVRAL